MILSPIPVPNSDDILDFHRTDDGMGYVASLTRRQSNGSSLWTAIPPEGVQQDAWTGVRLKGPHVIAYSWSGFVVEIDLETGAEVTRTFTK